MFLTEDLLKRMIQEINDDYLTKLPGTDPGEDWHGIPGDSEVSMDALTSELVDIQLDVQEGVSFMGRGMDYEEFLTIVGNYVVSYENRRGGAPNKALRKDIKRAVHDALADVPQTISDSIAEVLEDYIDDDRHGGYGMSDSPEVTGDYEQ
jgi:hypothetical protein